MLQVHILELFVMENAISHPPFFSKAQQQHQKWYLYFTQKSLLSWLESVHKTTTIALGMKNCPSNYILSVHLQ